MSTSNLKHIVLRETRNLFSKILNENVLLYEYERVNSKNIDSWLHHTAETIYDVFFENEPDVINNSILYIPTVLEKDNAAEYFGVRLATHIRLMDDIQYSSIPIVLMGIEPVADFIRRSSLSTILHLPNTYYIDFSHQALSDFIRTKSKVFLEKKRQIEFRHLKKLNIQPPSNYSSHHSIDNELALLRWSLYTGLDSPEIQKMIDKLKKQLYFKYILKLYPVELPNDNKRFLLETENATKILLVDDEANKGWDEFYKQFFQLTPSITYKSLDINFQKGRDKILQDLQENLETFDPDVVLLDLRLHDADFKDGIKAEDLTGYKVLKAIKEKNRGIQVIITTASNKVWNYEPLMNAGANGYIIKNGYSDVKDDIDRLKAIIEITIKRSGYLKPVWAKKEKIISNLKSFENPDRKDFISEATNQLELAYKLLDSAIDKEDFAYAFITLYPIIEKIANEFIEKQKGIWKIKDGDDLKKWEWDKENGMYIDNGDASDSKLPVWQKIAGLFFQKWKQNDHKFIKQVYHLIEKRHGFVHKDDSILNKTDKKGNFLNHDIYSEEGFIKLLNAISRLINLIVLNP